MTALMMTVLTLVMLATAFLSGLFGMAGGLILMGVLLVLLPLPEAMGLHAVTQMASNGWRGLLWFGHVRWRAAMTFLGGCALAFTGWSLWRYVPSPALAFLLLGASPFLVNALPKGWKPDPERWGHGLVFGAASMSLMLLTGVSGPLIDAYFLSGRFDRREIVATKAACQIASHAAKLLYFGGLVAEAGRIDPLLAALAVGASVLGTTAAKPVLTRLSEERYRSWARRIILVIASAYLAQGAWLLLRPHVGG